MFPILQKLGTKGEACRKKMRWYRFWGLFTIRMLLEHTTYAVLSIGFGIGDGRRRVGLDPQGAAFGVRVPVTFGAGVVLCAGVGVGVDILLILLVFGVGAVK